MSSSTMPSFRLLSALAFALSALPLAASAQTPNSSSADDAPTIRMYRGQVSGAQGPLPGAVVKLPNSARQAVTNSDGQFQLAAPASTLPIPAIVSYVGFADENIELLPGNAETIVIMSTPVPVKVAKKYQLKAYQKTANKQVKRSLRELR